MNDLNMEQDDSHSPNIPRPSKSRRKDPSRTNVTRACDRCKKRKVRCTGLQPCQICVDANAQCDFTAPYKRGRRSHRPVQDFGDSSLYSLAARERHRTSLDHENGLSPDILESTTHNFGHASQDNTSIVPETHRESAPQSGRAQPDLHGHYVGPTSGVSFLLRAQKRLQQFKLSCDVSSIFTFGDPPLRSSGPTYCVVMSKEDTLILVQRFFDFAVPVDRFLHRPTIEGWLRDFHDTNDVSSSGNDAPTRRALLFMVFALAEEHMSPKPAPGKANLSTQYFLAAEALLSQEKGDVHLASVQARLCQCLWLLGQSRINHCWNLFGTTARLALAIGLHRGGSSNQIYGRNCIDVECRRRTFWSLYSLDHYLSTALGRPRIFHDDDIDQDLPLCCDDDDVQLDCIKTSVRSQQSLLHAPVAYFKLCRTLSKILRDLYSIRPPSFANQCRFINTYSQDLKNWRAELSEFLDSNTSLLIPIFLRQRNVLNLAYWHTTILVHRQIFLHDVLSSSRTGDETSEDHPHTSQIHESIQECLNSALNIVKTVESMIVAGQMFRAYWFTPYFAFSAVVILYVHTIRRISLSLPEDHYQPCLQAALQCHDQINSIAEKGSLTSRYCMVLDELRIETIQRMQRLTMPLTSVPDVWTGDTRTEDQDSLLTPSGGPVLPPEVIDGRDSDDCHENLDGSSEDIMGTFNSILASGSDLEGLLNFDFLRH